MSDIDFYNLFGAALAAADRDAFVSDWALSTMWGDAETDEIPDARVAMLVEMWDVAHMSVREIRSRTGLTQAAFCTRFCMPKRTLENWEGGKRSCPDYVRLMLAELSGAYTRP